MLFERPVLVADEVEPALGLVDAGKVLHHPGTLGELSPFALGETVEMAIAVALRAPDQAAVLQRAIGVAEVETAPLAGLLGEEYRRLAGRRIDAEHVENLLVAALALHEQGLAVGRPVDPG